MDKQRRPVSRFVSAAAAAVLVAGLTSCGTIDIASSWRTSEIVVDGRSGDWGGHLRVIEKTPYAIGILNDAESIYICLRGDVTAGAGGFERSGLTVWIDPKGGTNKVLGVRFPIGMEMTGLPGEGPSQPFNDPSMGNRRSRPEPAGPPDSGDEVEILRPGTDVETTRMKRSDLKDIEVELTRSPGGLIYELKVPLPKTEPKGEAGAAPVDIVGIGFEPGAAGMGMMGNRGMGGSGGIGGMGGMGGRGGMSRGMPGGYGGRDGMDRGEQFKAWFKVTLAKPPVTPKT